MPQSDTPVLIIVGGCTSREYRGYCLESASAAYPLALIDTEPPTWNKAHIIDHELATGNSTEAVVDAGLRLAARHRVAGVLTWDEYRLLQASALAVALGLPGSPVSAMLAARDKGTSRRLFQQHGVPSATSTRVHSLDEATRAGVQTGFPVVLKPAAACASFGVVRVDNANQLAHHWSFVARAAGDQPGDGDGILVEEYLDGPEVSVECVTQRGVITAVAVTRKQIGFAPYFEEVGHTVTAEDPLMPVVAPVAAQAITALGITDGVQHVEMRLTAGGPKIIEVNARIGGDLIGRLVRLATGVDLPRIAADIACGRPADIASSMHASAAVGIVYAPASGTLAHRDLNGHAAIDHEWLNEVSWLLEPGDYVALPPVGDLDTARIGMFVVTADTHDQAQRRIQTVNDHVEINVSAA